MGKLRVAFLMDRVERPLFSCEEKKKDHSLLIGMDIPVIGDGHWKMCDSFHISIHNSPNSTGITITSTYTSDSDETKYVAFIKDGKIKLNYPIINIIHGTLDTSQRTLKKKPSDRMRRIIGYDSSVATMTTTIFVTSKNVNPPAIFGFSRSIIKFNLYNLIVYTTFTDAISPPISLYEFAATSAPQKNKISIVSNFQNSVVSLRPSKMKSYIYNKHITFQHFIAEAILAYFPKASPLAIYRKYTMRQDRWPNLNDPNARFYGEHAPGRRNNRMIDSK